MAGLAPDSSLNPLACPCANGMLCGSGMDRPSRAERFWSKVNKDGPVVRADLGPCWEWTGARRQRGRYGSFGIGSTVYYAHRVAWELANGPIPASDSPHGTCVLHRCDNKICVNPGHLSLGTHSDNMLEKAARGLTSHASLPGEKNPGAKLSAPDVVAIRAMKAAGASTIDLAMRYGVEKSAIKRIAARTTWRHIA